MVTAATIYMSLLGYDGLARVARESHRNTHKLLGGLTAIDGVERLFDGPFFHEATVRLDYPVAEVLEELADRDILGGLDLSTHDFGNAMLVCATETKTDADIDAYVSAMRDVLQPKKRKSV